MLVFQLFLVDHYYLIVSCHPQAILDKRVLPIMIGEIGNGVDFVVKSLDTTGLPDIVVRSVIDKAELFLESKVGPTKNKKSQEQTKSKKETENRKRKKEKGKAKNEKRKSKNENDKRQTRDDK